MSYETELLYNARALDVYDSVSLAIARHKANIWSTELNENLLLNMGEVKEYRKCINIIKEKIDDFIDVNPEYGV